MKTFTTVVNIEDEELRNNSYIKHEELRNNS